MNNKKGLYLTFYYLAVHNHSVLYLTRHLKLYLSKGINAQWGEILPSKGQKLGDENSYAFYVKSGDIHTAHDIIYSVSVALQFNLC